MSREKLTAEQKAQMRKLFDECGLNENDVHTHKHYVIITRSGIEKIQNHYSIEVKFNHVKCEPEFAAVRATGRFVVRDAVPGYARTGTKPIYEGQFIPVQSYGSAHPKNCQTSYFLEMAEKRALARVVLKMTKMYENGFKSEDEHLEGESK